MFEWIQTDLSSFYFKSTKDRLYCDAKDSTSRRAAQAVYYQIYEQLLTCLVPICPMLVIEAWDNTPALAKSATPSPLQRARQDIANFPTSDTRGFERFLHQTISAMNAAWAQSSVKGGEVQCHAVIDLPEIGDNTGSLYSFLRSNETEVNETLAQVFGTSSAELRFFGTSTTPDPYQPQTDLAFAYSSTFDILGDQTVGNSAELDQSLRVPSKATLWLHPTGLDKCIRCYRYLAESAQAPHSKPNIHLLEAKAPLTLDSSTNNQPISLCGRCKEAVETLGIPVNPPSVLLDQLEPKATIDEIKQKWHISQRPKASAL